MKARVIEIKRFAVHDGDGIRTTLFLKGCPLSCVWCHNPEGICAAPQLAYMQNKCIGCGLCVAACSVGAHSIKDGVHCFDRDKCVGCGKCEEECLVGALKFYGREMSVDELVPLLTEDREFYENSGGGVTLSGGECLCHPDFCAELLKRLKEQGISTAVDTCGAVGRDAIDKVMPYTDVFLYDVKAIDADVHKACTGLDNKRILENLKYIDDCGKRIEVRYPYVPGYNSEEAEKIGEFLATLKNLTAVRVLPYHKYAGSKYSSLDMENRLPERMPDDKEIEAARKAIGRFGIKVI